MNKQIFYLLKGSFILAIFLTYLVVISPVGKEWEKLVRIYHKESFITFLVTIVTLSAVWTGILLHKTKELPDQPYPEYKYEYKLASEKEIHLCHMLLLIEEGWVTGYNADYGFGITTLSLKNITFKIYHLKNIAPTYEEKIEAFENGESLAINCTHTLMQAYLIRKKIIDDEAALKTMKTVQKERANKKENELIIIRNAICEKFANKYT